MYRAILLFATLLLSACASTLHPPQSTMFKAAVLNGHEIKLDTTPNVSFAPANIVLKITIERHPDNRKVVWTCDGEALFTSEEFTLEGENSRVVWILDKALRSLPVGDYVCSAELVRVNTRFRARSQFRVVGAGAGQ